MNNTTRGSNADYGPFFLAQFATAIFLALLSPVTVISNMLLLLAILKDPLKCFRTPATYFIVALALSDLVTGLVVQPCFILYRLAQYLKRSLRPGEPYNTLKHIGNSLTYVGLNSSFLLVLGLIWSQYFAIKFPHKFRSMVSTRKVLASIGVSLAYFTGFTLLQFAAVPIETLYKVDVHLHSTLITVLLIMGAVCLLRAFRAFAKASRRLGVGASFETRDTRGTRLKNQPKKISEKQFTIATLLLSLVLVVCSLPHIIVIHIKLYSTQATLQEKLDLAVAITIANESMFVKVALDAFICAWRLTKYRRSLKIVLTCRGNRVMSADTEIRTLDNFTFQRQDPQTTNHE